MKKLVLFLMLCLALQPYTAYAYDVSAEFACVMIADTGEVVYDKNAYSRHAMASTTKIMTAFLAIEQNTLSDVVSVSNNAAGQEGSSLYLRAGDKIKMQNLLYGLMLNSGNDAAVAVAEHVSGSVEQFAKDMTRKAQELGASDTQFQNPNGLDADGHYTTAYDLALITRAALKSPEFREIVATKQTSVQLENSNSTLYFSNHNKMLKLYEGAIGVKTGFTKATGRCLVSAAERDGVMVIAVTLNAPDDWNDHEKMLDDAFLKYEKKTVLQKGQSVKELMAGETHVRGVLADSVEVVCKKDTDTPVDVTLHLVKQIAGSIYAGDKIGYAEVKTATGTKEVDVLCDRTVLDVQAEPGFWDVFFRVLNRWFVMG